MKEKILDRNNLSGVQIIVIVYFFAAIIGTLLFKMPIFHQNGISISFIDSLFTSVSAISVTGLTVVNTAETFNIAGKVLLMIFFQFGGVGIMTLGTFVWLIMGKKIGLKERQLIMIDQNRSDFAGLVKLIKKVFGMALIIEGIGGLILGTYFLKFYEHWYEAYFNGIFHAVSGFTNAGFDIFGDSLIRFGDDYFVQAVIIVLIIFGAIGFPVLLEVRNYLETKKNRRNFRFSLFTKLTVSTFFLLLVIGTIIIFLAENNSAFAGMPWHQKLFYSLFSSITARNAGLSTIDISIFNTYTLLIISTLMIIGASPSGAGGGIKTTTFAILILSVVAFARGKKSIKIFKRSVEIDDMIKSFVVFVVFVMVWVIGIILLNIFEDTNFTLMEIVFEVSSAFSTTGLSMGITEFLSSASKVTLIILMFIGRIGIASILILFAKNRNKVNINYPSEKVIIG